MMRLLCYAAALAAMLAFFCTFPLLSVEKHCYAMEQELSLAATFAMQGDLEQAAPHALAARSLWDNWQTGANMYLRHAELDPVKAAMGEMLAWLETGEAAEFYSACSRTRLLVQHLSESEWASIGNIL